MRMTLKASIGLAALALAAGALVTAPELGLGPSELRPVPAGNADSPERRGAVDGSVSPKAVDAADVPMAETMEELSAAKPLIRPAVPVSARGIPADQASRRLATMSNRPVDSDMTRAVDRLLDGDAAR